jgi:hypothetical protein
MELIKKGNNKRRHSDISGKKKKTISKNMCNILLWSFLK